jgi:hypothetical protein
MASTMRSPVRLMALLEAMPESLYFSVPSAELRSV